MLLLNDGTMEVHHGPEEVDDGGHSLRSAGCTGSGSALPWAHRFGDSEADNRRGFGIWWLVDLVLIVTTK